MKPIDNKKVNTELYFVNFGVKSKMCIALPLPPLYYDITEIWLRAE